MTPAHLIIFTDRDARLEAHPDARGVTLLGDLRRGMAPADVAGADTWRADRVDADPGSPVGVTRDGRTVSLDHLGAVTNVLVVHGRGESDGMS